MNNRPLAWAAYFGGLAFALLGIVIGALATRPDDGATLASLRGMTAADVRANRGLLVHLSVYPNAAVRETARALLAD